MADVCSQSDFRCFLVYGTFLSICVLISVFIIFEIQQIAALVQMYNFVQPLNLLEVSSEIIDIFKKPKKKKNMAHFSGG